MNHDKPSNKNMILINTTLSHLDIFSWFINEGNRIPSSISAKHSRKMFITSSYVS